MKICSIHGEYLGDICPVCGKVYAHLDDGGPAFPVGYDFNKSGELQHIGNHSEGMTLRDYFAGQALMYVLANLDDDYENIAKEAYKYADAMIEARKK